MSEPESTAIMRLKRGEIGGLETLVNLYQVQAVRAAYLIVRDRAAAEDIAQAAFLQAYERIASFDSLRPFKPWFLKSVVNEALKHTARGKRFVSLPDEDSGRRDQTDSLDPALIVEADIGDSGELQAAVWRALDKLPPEQRAAIVLRYFLELDDAEIAQAQHTARGTVKWRLHMARRKLQALLRPVWQAELKEGQER